MNPALITLLSGVFLLALPILAALMTAVVMRSGSHIFKSFGAPRNRLRSDEVARWARDAGFDFAEEVKVSALTDMQRRAFSNELHTLPVALEFFVGSTCLRNVVRWQSNLAEFWLFDVDAPSTQSRSTRGLIAFRQFALPEFALRPRRLMEITLFQSEIKFRDDPEFLRQWVLLSRSVPETTAFFSSSLRKWFSQQLPRFHIRAAGRFVVFGIPAIYAFRPQTFAQYQEYGVQLATAISEMAASIDASRPAGTAETRLDG